MTAKASAVGVDKGSDQTIRGNTAATQDGRAPWRTATAATAQQLQQPSNAGTSGAYVPPWSHNKKPQTLHEQGDDVVLSSRTQNPNAAAREERGFISKDRDDKVQSTRASGSVPWQTQTPNAQRLTAESENHDDDDDDDEKVRHGTPRSRADHRAHGDSSMRTPLRDQGVRRATHGSRASRRGYDDDDDDEVDVASARQWPRDRDVSKREWPRDRGVSKMEWPRDRDPITRDRDVGSAGAGLKRREAVDIPARNEHARTGEKYHDLVDRGSVHDKDHGRVVDRYKGIHDDDDGDGREIHRDTQRKDEAADQSKEPRDDGIRRARRDIQGKDEAMHGDKQTEDDGSHAVHPSTQHTAHVGADRSGAHAHDRRVDRYRELQDDDYRGMDQSTSDRDQESSADTGEGDVSSRRGEAHVDTNDRRGVHTRMQDRDQDNSQGRHEDGDVGSPRVKLDVYADERRGGTHASSSDKDNQGIQDGEHARVKRPGAGHSDSDDDWQQGGKSLMIHGDQNDAAQAAKIENPGRYYENNVGKMVEGDSFDMDHDENNEMHKDRCLNDDGVIVRPRRDMVIPDPEDVLGYNMDMLIPLKKIKRAMYREPSTDEDGATGVHNGPARLSGKATPAGRGTRTQSQKEEIYNSLDASARASKRGERDGILLPAEHEGGSAMRDNENEWNTINGSVVVMPNNQEEEVDSNYDPEVSEEVRNYRANRQYSDPDKVSEFSDMPHMQEGMCVCIYVYVCIHMYMIRCLRK